MNFVPTSFVESLVGEVRCKYVALPVDVDGRVWKGTEARVVHGGKRMFMDGLLWDGKEWRVYQRSADGTNHSIDLRPEECAHADTFREVIQKALVSDPTQELEDELVEMCRGLVRPRLTHEELNDAFFDVVNDGLECCCMTGFGHEAVYGIMPNDEFDGLFDKFASKVIGD